MAKRDELFVEDGLFAPPLSPALKNLFAVLKGKPRHPVAQRLSYHHVRQYWELHKALYTQPDVIIELLADHYAEVAKCIPLPCEALALAKACWRMWYDMASTGINVDYEHEPELPTPSRRRVPRRVFPPEEDD
jgi:hypothetical protein